MCTTIFFLKLAVEENQECHLLSLILFYYYIYSKTFEQWAYLDHRVCLLFKSENLHVCKCWGFKRFSQNRSVHYSEVFINRY